MPPITIEAIEAKQSELDKLIQQFKAQSAPDREIEIDGRTITLGAGELYAGPVLDADGNHMHDLVVLAARPGKRLDWKAALEWAEDVGGALPTRQEQALIFANCKPHLEGAYHWSCEEYEENASYAWSCYFSYGGQRLDHKANELAAVAVRRF